MSENYEQKVSKKTAFFNRIFQYEISRYSRKGYNIFIAIAIVIVFFTVAVNLGPIVFPKQINNPGLFSFTTTVLYHEFLFIFCNLLLLMVYKSKSTYFEKFKTSPEKWPWEENYEEWIILFKSSCKTLVINQFIILPITLLRNLLKDFCTTNLDYDELPGIVEMVSHIAFFTLCEDFLFYASHRLLHWGFFYTYIHKIHHKYQQTVGIASENAHPIEFLIGNIIPSSMGSIILRKRTHFYTTLVWITIRIFKTTDAHSGYEFPFSPFGLPLFSAQQEYHNYHHLYFKGNYGSFFTFWDRIFGTTNNNFLEYSEQFNNEKKNN